MALMRLQRFLAQAGVAARRKAEVLITEGKVKVNGKKVTVLGTKIDPENDRVSVSGEPVHQEELFFAVFNKPKGCITAVSDPEGRRTVLEYLPGLPASVMPVGRLDFYSEGVLLLTNDGALAAALTSSRRNIEKVYHIKLKGTIDDREIKKLRTGVRLDYRTVTKPAEVERLKATSRHDWLEVTLTEGKNRQLHRMLEALDHEITKLQRISFAGLNFHGLRVGDARELNQSELKELYDVAGVKIAKGLQTRGKWAVKRETTDKARRNADRTRERVTPNLTPGGSKVAKAKLLTRYREQEEDGTAPARPVPRAVAKEKAQAARRAAAKRKPKAKTATTKAKRKPPARGAARNAKPAPKRGARPAAKSGARPAAKSGARPAAKSGARPAASRGARPAASRGARPAAKKATAKRASGKTSAGRKNATSKPSRGRAAGAGSSSKTRTKRTRG
jgi:23S rRNA pseudouridine2605 synthase